MFLFSSMFEAICPLIPKRSGVQVSFVHFFGTMSGLATAFLFSFTGIVLANPHEIKAEFLSDYQLIKDGEGKWSDGSKTGTWAVGFGNRWDPASNFVIAKFDPKIAGFHGAYGFSTRFFANDPNRTIFPGESSYSGSAVIRWTADASCIVSVIGKIALSNELRSGDEDGIDIYLYREKTRLLTIKDVIDTNPQEISTGSLHLNAGESIYFVISPKGNNANDSTHIVEEFLIVGHAE